MTGVGGFVPKKQSALLRWTTPSSVAESPSPDKVGGSPLTMIKMGSGEKDQSAKRASEGKLQSVDDKTSEQSDDSTDPSKSRRKCLIYPDDKPKRVWDAILGLLLIVMCLTIPGHLALYWEEEDPVEVIIFNRVLDAIFGIDIFLTFNTALLQGHDEIITDKAEIAKRYLKGWFWIDLIVTLPLDRMVQVWYPQIKELASMVKFVRIMKIIRLIRLIKLLKIFKDRKKMIFMRSALKVSNGI